MFYRPGRGYALWQVALGRGHGTRESIFPDIPGDFHGPHREPDVLALQLK